MEATRAPAILQKAYKGIANKGGYSPLSVISMRKYTRFEKARIIGARALQISLGAPVLIEIPEGVIDPIEIAKMEFGREVIPIDVKRDE